MRVSRGDGTMECRKSTHVFCTRRLLLWAWLPVIGLLSSTASGQQISSDYAEVQELVAAPAPVPDPLTCPPPDGTRPDPTLVNTDPFVMDRFGLRKVLAHLIRRGGATHQTPVALYQQLWDTLETRSEAKFSGPHCDDLETPSINGFPIECRRIEADLKDSDPSLFVPVALTNRFDLAPADGANCGEYRIVYAMRPFTDVDRNFIIFEGLLLNPTPRRGLEGCRPVVNFWESLTNYNVRTPRGKLLLANALDNFYFNGLPGFAPVLEPTNLGLSPNGAPSEGRVRTNLFGNAPTWQLREHRMARACEHERCQLYFDPAPVADNPFPALFDGSNPAPEAADFQSEFISQVENLANDDMNLISMDVDERFYAGQSTSTVPTDGSLFDGYLEHAINGVINGSLGFYFDIANELSRIGRTDLSPFDITVRATTQSCAGCHNITRLTPLSFDGAGGPVWPDTRPLGFVHIDEEGFLSPALWCTFLPFRKSTLDTFYRSRPKPCTSGKCSTVVRPPGARALRRNQLEHMTVSGRRRGAE